MNFNKQVLAIVATVVTLVFGVTLVFAATANTRVQVQPTGYAVNYAFFKGTSTTTVAGLTGATSTNATTTNDAGFFNISGAKRVEVFFQHGGIATTSTGTSTFSVQVSPDGVNWYNFGRLVSSTSSTPTIQPSSLLPAATSTEMYGLDLRTDAFYGLRCIIYFAGTSGTAGENSCSAYAEY